MVGLLVILVVSWVFLRLIEKKNIEVLGIIPYPKRIAQFFIGMALLMLINLIGIYIESIVMKVDWELNSSINYTLIYESIIYHLKSAITEDLVFRGAILYILISRIGAKWAILVSAILFGMYHVFSYGMTGDRIIPIMYVILVTGFVGYVWAYTFHKTKSIFMALGFHLGSNLINTFFFDAQPYGELIFTEISRANVSEWNNFLFQIFKGLFPTILTLIFLKLALWSDLKIFQPNGQN